MIDPASLPPFRKIREDAGLSALDRHGRGECFACGSSDGFSQSEAKGLWHCFSCNAGGDKVAFIQQALGTDFLGVLSYLGLDTKQPLWCPDPELLRKRQEELDRQDRVRAYGRMLRDEFFNRDTVRHHALERLAGDEQDELGWWMLQVAYTSGRPLEELEAALNRIDLARSPEEIAAADLGLQEALR
jgi:hypothetical protein